MPADPLAALASSVSVSCRDQLDAATLDAILRTGHYDERWFGHLMIMVDEAPLDMLARVLAGYPPDERDGVVEVWRALGREVGSDRIERWMTG